MRKRRQEETDLKMIEACLELTEALYQAGAASEADVNQVVAARDRVKETVRGFDVATLTPTPDFTPESVRALREREGASQALMAKYLGVAVQTVGQWERGQRKPDGPAAKLLALVQAHGLQYIK